MVLRLIPLALLALAGPIRAQEPVRVPAKKVPTTVPTQKAPVTAAPSKEPGTVPAVRKPLMTDIVPTKVGWLGFRTDPNDREIILEVAPDSPAERAGMRPGDRIVSSDRLVERVVTRTDSAIGARPAGLRLYVAGPILGRTYHMTLARGDETFDISMIAVAPPAHQRGVLRPTRAPGAISDTLEAEVEALRTELARTTLQPSRKQLPTRVRRPESLQTRADSEAARQADLYDALVRQDRELYATVERYNAQRAKGEALIDSPELYESLKTAVERADRTALTLDRRTNAISGAEFEELNPVLGEYFGGIPDGVLVIRVGAESPAANAGLQPGDVVKTVNGVDIATVSSLRERIAGTSGTITLGVIRKGRLSTVTLRKE